MVEEKRNTTSDISTNLYLLSTGQPVIDLGKIRVGKADHDYREILVLYTKAELNGRRISKMHKTHHRMIVRTEKMGALP